MRVNQKAIRREEAKATGRELRAKREARKQAVINHRRAAAYANHQPMQRWKAKAA